MTLLARISVAVIAFPMLSPLQSTGQDLSGRYGTSASPLSWAEVPSSENSGLSGPGQVFGPEMPPASVKLVEFRDARPYGERSVQFAWLARYDSIQVSKSPAEHAVLTLFVAYDARTTEVRCVFTAPSTSWLRSPLESDDVLSRVSHECATRPAQYSTLTSGIPAVLGALWTGYDIDPTTAGQVIIRPRLVQHYGPQKWLDGELVPRDPPANEWIVEVLGTRIRTVYPPPAYDLPGAAVSLNSNGFDLTILVAFFRDGDLKDVGGLVTP